MGDFNPASAALFALDMISKNRQGKARERMAQQQADREISQLNQEQAVRDRKRREQLKRIMATQRAQFGAKGIGRGGSADAVLDGFRAASARDEADDAASIGSRISDINAGVAGVRRRNLLERRNMVQDRIFGELRRRLPTISLFDK